MGMRAGEAGEISVRGSSEDRPLNDEETTLSETRKYRKFTPQQKLELVMASWRGERSIAELCREHDISEALLRRRHEGRRPWEAPHGPPSRVPSGGDGISPWVPIGAPHGFVL